MLKNIPSLLLACLALALGGCSSAKGPSSDSAATQTPTGGSAPTGGSSASGSNPGSVSSKVEQAGAVQYKAYRLAGAPSYKGIVLFGSGNNENDPSTGSLDGALENNAANELAKLGYVAAVVAYRDEAPVKSDSDWNSNCEMLATDMSNVANAIISNVGGGLSRNKVITGGVSYASYALLTNITASNTLADTRGVLATCGSTQDLDPKIPIFNVNCSGNPDGDFNGQALIDKIPNAKVKADSGYFTDPACNSHCGGDTNAWTAKIVERVQQWLP